VYSLAYGDQPAIICDLVDWARAAGFPWSRPGAGPTNGCRISRSPRRNRVGLLRPYARAGPRGRTQPKMFNSFLDGLEPAIRSHAGVHATGLTAGAGGTRVSARLHRGSAAVMRPKSEGGQLHHKGQVEVVSVARSDGRAIPYDIRLACWVVFGASPDYIRRLLHGIRRPNRPCGR